MERDGPAGNGPVTPVSILSTPVLKVRPVTADSVVARRAMMEVGYQDFVNLGAGLPSRDMFPLSIEEGVDRDSEFSLEAGVLGGINNGVGFRSNVTSILDTPAIFSLYSSGIPSATFLSMLEFDAAGNVNLLKHGNTWVGPGGAIDIAHGIQRVIFCGTFRAGGLRASGEAGTLRIECDGRIPRAVEHVQAICFNGPKMFREGKEVIYITERAVFRLAADGPELVEVAPGVDVERDVLAQMCFKPRISPDLREMDARAFTPGIMGLRAAAG